MSNILLTKTPFLIRGWRIARISLHVLIGLTLATLVLPVANRNVRTAIIQWWCRRLLRCFNITLTISGALPGKDTHGVLFVANHISWVDIHAINSLLPVRFVAKLEVRNWPVFGYLVRKSGTIFINRTRQRDAARVVQIASNALKLRDNLCVFPEGTTTEGTQVLPFKSSLIQAAIDANTIVIPVAIRYAQPDGSLNLAAAYAGETTMVESMLAFIHMRSPTVHLHFCHPILAREMSRQALAELAHAEITQVLSPISPSNQQAPSLQTPDQEAVA
ncbi:lysophospholipid acyltransferase family protein [Methylophilus flavus]|uniref:Lysophospholipid acyltransferase family protein n=1 Tax=Methylophilus flavus TaxID=640084 RepID=A0ABW3PGE6_9PROT